MTSAKGLILKYLKENDIKHAWLARRMGTKPQYLWKKFQKKDLESEFITKISVALQHNFYEDLSMALEAEMKGVKPLSEILNEPEVKYKANETMLRKIVSEELQKQSGKN